LPHIYLCGGDQPPAAKSPLHWRRRSRAPGGGSATDATEIRGNRVLQGARQNRESPCIS
jgi:hypothetical protein